MRGSRSFRTTQPLVSIRGRIRKDFQRLRFIDGIQCQHPAVPADLSRKSDHSLWGGLIIARQSDSPELLEAWLKQMAESACYLPAAAVAALVLQPGAPEHQQNLWRATLQNPLASRWALEAVWWSRHTWPMDQWEQLKDDLRPYATADRGAGFFNWLMIDEKWVHADYEQHPVEPLWAMEYLAKQYQARQPVNDRPLRNQMVERLIQSHGDPMASVVLRFLDEIKSGKASR